EKNVDASKLSKPSESSETFFPQEWTAEDEASYWYGQVEITTHLGPLRRVWMGPQCTFRTYSHLTDTIPSCTVARSSDSGTNTNDSSIAAALENMEASLLQTLSTMEGPKLLPPLNEPDWLARYYAQPRSETELSELGDISGQINLCTRSSLSGALMTTLPESGFTGLSSRVPPRTAVPARPPTSRPMDASVRSRWRNRSGDVIRPMSLVGDTTDAPVYIEGGSYQDSSFGGSLSSLTGRSVDDVASCIADAMQDEEPNWCYHRSNLDTLSSATTVLPPAQCSDLSQMGGRTAAPVPSGRPIELAIHSALSEADFPSQNVSPSLTNPSKSQWSVDEVSAPVDTFVTPASPLNDSKPPGDAIQVTDAVLDPTGSNKPTTLAVKTAPKGSRSKRSRRAKARAHKSGALSATEGPGDEQNVICFKKYHSAMASPCVSGTDSLSSSPAVADLIIDRPRNEPRHLRDDTAVSVSPTVDPGSDAANSQNPLNQQTLCNPDQLASSKQESSISPRDETLISMEGSTEQQLTLTDEPDNVRSEPTEQQVSGEYSNQDSEECHVENPPNEDQQSNQTDHECNSEYPSEC
ncbi:unnamed protein product, partial [Echinostoma caproni]|uniref:BCAS3 domain-containing protein n=1 Tax=Echinostoma caproni TaxID=27848 RepID=A0A183A8Q5_9TREM